MSGAAVPYRLRPHKAVDRRIFLTLLARFERWKDIGDYVYASMGAWSLEDQKLVHRLLGIRRLLAFDMDSEIVARQLFNRPIDECKCVRATSGDVSADIASAVERAEIDDAEGYIVWLDYTAPREIPVQIREFEKLAAQLGPGDIVRVTINAEFDFWAGKERERGRSVLMETRQARALQKLEVLLAEYMPGGVRAATLDPQGIAVVLARAFGLAAGKAVPVRSGNVLEPLSLTRYADGQQMLSMTAAVVRREDVRAMREKMGLVHWPFASTTWDDVKFLLVPDLTVRERLFLERNAQKANAEITAEVGFDFDQVTEMPGFVENYRQYYRHYPALTPVEY